MRQIRAVVATLSMIVVGAHAAAGQRAALNGDSLLRRGMIERAESVYYANSRMHPRDPAARWALGNYLIQRGARRIGMTLVEEAVQFGYDKPAAGKVLAPVYLDLGEYAKLLALPTSPLSAPEKDAVRYLEAHPTRTIAPDSVVSGAYTPATPASGILGTIAIRVNGRTVNATIVNGYGELTLNESSAAANKSLHRFGNNASGPAVADSIGIARTTMTNAPLTVAALPQGTEARVGLGFLARYAPTFDPAARLITLRVSGNVPAGSISGNAFVTLVSSDRYSVLKAGGWASIDDPAIMSLLLSRRWTLDAKRGTIILAQ